MRIAAAVGAEIVSADSMQVYRGMDIGTAKPTPEERARVPHHLVDLLEPEERFTVAEAQIAGRAAIAALQRAVTPVLIVGGSGLHFRALVDPYRFSPTDEAVRAEVEAMPDEAAVAALVEADPDSAGHVDLANLRRVVRALEVFRLTGTTPSQRAAAPEAAAIRAYRSELPITAVGFDPGDGLRGRVERRFDAMLTAGLTEEVASVADRLGPTAIEAVGYKQLIAVAEGRVAPADGRRRAIDATTSLARRQRTFFRRDPRVRWLEWDDDVDRRVGAARSALEETAWIS